MTLYHVSPAKNIESILENGLIPRIGARTESVNDCCAIYLFTSRTSVDDAMLNWFCDEFEDDETFVLFEIDENILDMTHSHSDVEWELAYTKIIEPSAITLISTDI